MSCPYLLYNAIIFQTDWRKLPMIHFILPATILFIMYILSTAMTSPSHTNYGEIATSQYCKSWCLNVNYETSKVMILIRPVDFMGIQTITSIILNLSVLESISIYASYVSSMGNFQRRLVIG